MKMIFYYKIYFKIMSLHLCHSQTITYLNQYVRFNYNKTFCKPIYAQKIEKCLNKT